MSHEIRTPLTAVLGYAEILADEAPDDLRDYADSIRRGGERLLATLNSVLDLAQIEGGTYAIRREPIDVLAEAREACDALRPLAAAKGVALSVQRRRRRRPRRLRGHRARAEQPGRQRDQVHGRRARSRCASRPRPGSAVLRISDTGAGISRGVPAAPVRRVPARVRGRRAAPTKATGWAWRSRSRLVEMMDGEIAVESVLGDGSTFTVRLPLATEARAPAAPRCRNTASARA